jgi:Cd2+/Zn2+-exporting ATPase
VNASRKSIKSLLSIKPDTANLIVGDDIRRVSPEIVEPGSLILVRAGEKIPLDGRVEEGTSSLNAQALTGESLPRSAGPGDEVFSGMINLSGLLRIRTEKPLSESAASKIIELVENASKRKARAEKFITSFAKYYTPAVMGAAALLALLPPLFGAGPFSLWLYRALVMLVISCPCALVVSIPLGYFGGMGAAAKKGILFKGGDSIDALAKLKAVAFDKTGTLTSGGFSVKGIYPAEGQSSESLLELAALAESDSSHPLALSIVAAHGKPLPAAASALREEIPGKGVRVDVGGKVLSAGNDALLHQLEIPHPFCSVPGTSVHVAVDERYAGYIELADEPKEDSRAAVAELHGLGLKTAMLSGDSAHAAESCADSLGIKTVRAALLPGAKLEALEELKAAWGSAAFVGDGINDAPVLAGADLGLAMGRLGSDAAIESADVVLMSDSPLLVPEAIRIALKTRRIIAQNLVLALGVKLVFLAFGAFGLATMWEAVFADVGVALLAVLNAVRMRKA